MEFFLKGSAKEISELLGLTKEDMFTETKRYVDGTTITYTRPHKSQEREETGE